MYPNNPSPKLDAANGIPTPPDAESLEYAEDRVQEAVRSTEALPIDTASPAGGPSSQYVHADTHKSSSALLRVYKNNSKLRTLLLCGILAAVIVGGFILIYKAQKNEDKNTLQSSQLNQQLEDENKSSNIDFGDRTLGVGANLIVKGSSTLQGNASVGDNLRVGEALVVEGQTSLTSLEVTGNTNINGQLTINGTVIAQNLQGSISGSFSGASSGSFSGSASGSFAGESTGTFKGLANGTFIGTFQGDGSQLTGINAASCANCVRLQGPTAIEQPGDIALAGGVRAHALNLRAAKNNAATFSVETATGEKLISADTLNKNVKVGNLLPNTKESFTPGSFTPGSTSTNATTIALTGDTGYTYNDAKRWVATGSDGRIRFVYIDQNTSDVVFVRCIDINCSQRNSQIVASEPINWTDTPSLALRADDRPYITYISYGDGNDPNSFSTIHLVQCADIDCSASTDNVVGTTLKWSYIDVVSVGADGNARIAYDSYNHWSSSPRIQQLWYVECTNVDCSTYNDTQIGPDDEGYYESIDILTAADNTVYLLYQNPSADAHTITRCINSDCTNRTNVNFGTGEGWNVSFTQGADGIIRGIYSDESPSGESAAYYFRCTDTVCSSVQTVLIDEVDTPPNGYSSISTSSLYYENNLPVMGYIRQYQEGINPSEYAYHLIRCNDLNCSTFTEQELQIDGIDQWNNMSMLFNGTRSLVYVDDNSGEIKVTYNFTINVVPDITVPDLHIAGTSIGSVNERFGQIYSAGINLQSAGSDPLLVVDRQTGLDSDIGSIASFRVNGIEKVGIDKNGTLDIKGSINVEGGSAGAPALIANATGVSIGADFSNLQNPAKLMIAAIAQDNSDAIQVLDNSSNVLFRVDNVGNIIAGSTSACPGCVPKSSLNEFRLPHGTGSHQYWQEENGRLYVYNSAYTYAMSIDNPTFPKQEATSFAIHGPFTTTADGNYLFGWASYGMCRDLLTIDISNKSIMSTVKTTVIPELSCEIPSVARVNNNLVIVRNNTLLIYDISNPLNPTKISTHTIPISLGYYSLYKMYSRNNIVYIADGPSVVTVDLTNPTLPIIGTPVQTCEYGSLGRPVFKNNLMYAVCSGVNFGTSAGIKIYNLGPSTVPTLLSQQYWDVTYTNDYGNSEAGVYLVANNVVATLSNGFMLTFDVSDDETLILKDYGTRSADIRNITSVGNYLYGYNFKEQRYEVLSSGESVFSGKVVAASANINGSLSVSGAARFTNNAYVDRASLTVNGFNTGTIYAQAGAGFNGSLLPQTYYYRVSEIDNQGTHSNPSPELQVDPNGINPPNNGNWSGSPPLDPAATPGATGPLTGSFRYRYTFTTAYGETTGSTTFSSDWTSNTVDVNNQVVELSNLYVNYTYSESITGINIYRCDMPACTAYYYVGNVPGPLTSQSVHSFTDTTVIPGVAMPTVNTGYTPDNTNIIYVQSRPDIKGYRVYRSSTSGSGYGYFDIYFTDQSGDISGGSNTTSIYDRNNRSLISGNPQNNNSSGRVGIGTDSPEVELHVVGNSRFVSGTNSTSAFVIQNATATTLLSADTTNLRVGIVTASPTRTLDVRGNALFRNTANSTASFSIQNASSTNLFVVDTTNMRVGVGLTSPSATLHASADGSGGSLFRVTDTTATARNVIDVADGGAAIFRNQTDSTTAFRVQNAAGTTILSVNTTDLRVEIASGANLHLAGSGNAHNAITKTLTCSATEALNDIVIITGTARVGRTTTANSNRVAGIVVAKPTATTCTIAIGGIAQVNFGTNVTPAAIGDPVTTSAISGMAESSTTPNVGAKLGNSTSAKDASNLVWVLIKSN